MPSDVFRVAAELLGLDPSDAVKLSKGRLIRYMRFRDVEYLVLRREFRGHPEGTLIAVRGGEYRIVPGYPPISRVLLLAKALQSHFIDKIVVEEKMNGYNVRVFMLGGQIYAATRGGYICPYTTARIRRMYGGRIAGILSMLGEDSFIAGEVVGMENPYTRQRYPEAPSFDYFVFDVYSRGLPLPPIERRRLVEDHGLRPVPLLGILDKHDLEGLKRIVRRLDSEGREGVVLKDPYNRVPPVKYTTGYANIDDLRLGMRFFFEEGRSFLFSRILREIFRAYEEEWDRRKLESEALRLGLAVLEPAVKAVQSVAEDKGLHEEYVLLFTSEEEMEEFEEYMSVLGVDIARHQVVETEEGIRVLYKKFKETAGRIYEILNTGFSPLD